MKITIHRGSKEIGGNCVELESQGKRLLIDIGLPLDANENYSKYLPKIPGLDGKDESLLGILISHPHQDHCGLLAEVAPNIKTGMGEAARRILTAAAPFMYQQAPQQAGWTFKDRTAIQIGPFAVTPYLVDHSAYDAYALLVEADGARVFYSGDFRAHGRKSGLFKKLLQNPPAAIDTLIMEGTAMGRSKENIPQYSEQDVERDMTKAMKETKGLVMVQCSAQNIDRVVSIYRASVKSGRTMVIDLYAAAILEATGNSNIPQSFWKTGVKLYVPKNQKEMVEKADLLSLYDRHSTREIKDNNIFKANPGRFTILFRTIYCWDLGTASCLEDSLYIYSQWQGYWENDSFDKLRGWIQRHNIQKKDIHSSGHAGIDDLQAFAKAINPKVIVPIHTAKPDDFTALFPNAVLHGDGKPWNVESSSACPR